MDTVHVKAFLEICKQKSYSKAAMVLHISQPAISQQIKRLENDLGFSLFHHSMKSRVELTKAGKIFYEYIEKEKKEYFAMLQKCKQDLVEKKTIILGVDFRDINRINKSFIEKYKKKYPDLEIQIKLENWQNLMHLFEMGEIDVVFGSEPLSLNPNYKFQEIDKADLAIVGNIEHQIFKKKQIRLEDLKNCHVSLPVDTMGKKIQEINETLHRLYPEILFEKPYTDINYIDILHSNILYLAEDLGEDAFYNLKSRKIESDLKIPLGFLYSLANDKKLDELARIY